MMMKHGEIEKADAMIFADTGAEPAAVYRWLVWLVAEIGSIVPFYKVQYLSGLTKHLDGS